MLPMLCMSQSELLRSFQNPPHASRPLVWWHWTASNVTREGITKDLEWMKRIGIGGFQAFDVSFGSGQSVGKKIKYMTPEWLELLKHTAAEADRLGLDMTIVTAAGWSETGGIWVKPHEAMKKLVWSQVQLEGGKKFTGPLPAPPFVNGPIRNLPKPGSMGGGSNKNPTYYKDQVLLAYPTPEFEKTLSTPLIRDHNAQQIKTDPLLDDDLASSISLETPTVNKNVYLQYEFPLPFTARSFSLAIGGVGLYPSKVMRPGFLQVSEDGKTYKTFHSIPGSQHDIRALNVRTFSFPEVTGKFFRVVFISGSPISTVGGPDDFGGFMEPAKAPTSFDILEAKFSSSTKVNRWEDKANFAPMFSFDHIKTPEANPGSIAPGNQVINITDKLKTDGSLDWDVPPGKWTILRMGFSLTGAQNGPAIPEASGFEVDKFNKEHLLSYMQQWSNPIAEALGPLYGKSLKYFLVDSYEADAQNWTDNIIEEFSKRRGYDPTRYLPALMGQVVESAEISDRFLWDYRLTLAELLVDNHYAAITEFAHKSGIKTYGEVAGISMPIIQDALRNKGAVDIPMGEFGMSQGLGSGEGKEWVSPADLDRQKSYAGANDRLNAHQADVREAASAAHIYGKKIVAAESWTGGGYEAPGDMKFIGDYWSTQGINQFIFHTSAHQPLDTKPGNTMVGTHFNRNITWAEKAKPFVDYISRNQFLLQEGRFVADIAFYLGQDIPAAVPYWEKLNYEIPEGYDHDFINTEILFRFQVENGDLVLPSGMRYKMLVLPEKNTMTLKVLEKMEQLVKEGATIIGPKPIMSPSLAGFPKEDELVKWKANELWGQADGRFIYKNNFGKGKIYWNTPLEGIFADMETDKDVAYTKPHINTRLVWIHRKTAEADIYFLLNMRNQEEDVDICFRVTGKAPERWNSDKGSAFPVAYKMEEKTTKVSLHLDPNESTFIVFEHKTEQKEKILQVERSTVIRKLDTEWKVEFPENTGAPKSISLPMLISLSEHAKDSVKFFSGTCTYSKSFSLSKSDLDKTSKYILDLGNVKDIAEVIINGKMVDTLWKKPYKTDITKHLLPGLNKIEIKITNQWDNRIYGDSKAPKNEKILQSGVGFGGPPKLKQSGLSGPVLLSKIKMDR